MAKLPVDFHLPRLSSVMLFTTWCFVLFMMYKVAFEPASVSEAGVPALFTAMVACLVIAMARDLSSRHPL